MFEDELKKYANALGVTLTQKRDAFFLEKVLAERKVFLSKKKLIYRARLNLDEPNRRLEFSEMLKESGMGLAGGDGEMSPGFGFKKETYSVGISGARTGSIQEQSSLFGKQYSYSFDYSGVRKALEQLAKNAGYTFEYKVI